MYQRLAVILWQFNYGKISFSVLVLGRYIAITHSLAQTFHHSLKQISLIFPYVGERLATYQSTYLSK